MDTQKLKVLMIATDRNVFVPNSAVAQRIKEYGKRVKELHVVILSDSAHMLSNIQLDSNIWVYPTSSSSKFKRPLDAAGLGKKIVLEKNFVRGESLIVTQDPFECGFNSWEFFSGFGV